MRDSQRRLAYKMAEQEAIGKLIEMEKKKDKGNRENIGKLKRMRHSLEFKISTEALSLAQEKMMVRKVGEINAQIEELLKMDRLERKKGLVSKDVETYQKTLSEVVAQVTELDGKLDALYSEIRKALGVHRRKPKTAMHKEEGSRPHQKPQDINLEDIVVIKKKDVKESARPVEQPEM